MKRLINQIFLIPILFIIFGFILFSVFYAVFVNNISEKEFKKASEIVINHKKEALKTELNAIKNAFDEIRLSSYSLTEKTMFEILKVVYKNYFHYNKGLLKYFQNHKTDKTFLYIKTANFAYPANLSYQYVTFGKLKHLIIVYNNKDYLAVEIKDGNKTIGMGIALDYIDNIVKKEFLDFISIIDKNNSSYVVAVQIENWFAKKGVFAKVLYHPLKKIINKPISIEKTDITGYPYRREYLKCLKHQDECFITYHFKNPITGKIEKKISYFTIYKPYDIVLMKGEYYSDIQKDINTTKKHILSSMNTLYKQTLYMFIIFILLSFLISYIISKKIQAKIIKDYEELKQNYEKAKNEIYRKVYYDKITNLPNKFKLLEELDNYESLVIFDIDDFANINNLYGFEYGNEVLNCFANFLKTKYENIYKIGNDEYAIGFKHKINATHIQDMLNLEIKCKNINIMYIIGASNIKDLFITAENALKTAQKSGLKYLIYDKKLKIEQHEKITLLQILKKILKEEDIIPYYQPIVDEKGNVVKYEALMRLKWDDAVLAPFQFMDLIKEARLYDDFSSIMIKKVFEDVKKYNLKNVSINASYIDIVSPHTKNQILKLLKTIDKDVKITFEILETESIKNYDLIKYFIKEVKEYNVRIAIDDFGSGYSNFINILSLKPDFIKIDGSLVKNIDQSEYFEIIKLINQFSCKFNIKAIAEFVENETIFNSLKKIGIKYYQGYYFSKPKPIKDIIKGKYEN